MAGRTMKSYISEDQVGLRPAERGGGENAQTAGRFCRRGQPHRAHHDLREARSAARYGLRQHRTIKAAVLCGNFVP